MGRPKRVYPNSLPKYDKLHTRKVKMYCGTELTALHLVKETDQFFMGFETWAFCCSKFRALKYGTELKFEIPTLADKNCTDFLNKHAWKDWVDKELSTEKKGGEMKETIDFLDRLYPNKKKVYFYELKSIVSAFCHGSFISYDKDGNIEEPREHAIKQRKYYSAKYKMMCMETPELKALYNAYDKVREGDKKLKDESFTKFHNASYDYVYQKYNLTDTFVKLGENTVVCPYAFSNPTVEGSSYEHAGEIYFIVTPDTVYFETERHY